MFSLKNEQVEEVLSKWLDTRKYLTGKLSVSDFDCWLGGFISGVSVSDNKVTKERFDEIIKYLVTSDSAKRCGVTGTEKETFEIYEIKS